MTVITNPHFTEVVQGIEDELARNGYGLLLGDSHDDPERELRLLHDLHQRRVDGVILAPSGDARLTLGYVREQSIPTVLIDRMASPEFDQVGTENLEFNGAAGFASGRSGSPANRDRGRSRGPGDHD